MDDDGESRIRNAGPSSDPPAARRVYAVALIAALAAGGGVTSFVEMRRVHAGGSVMLYDSLADSVASGVLGAAWVFSYFVYDAILAQRVSSLKPLYSSWPRFLAGVAFGIFLILIGGPILGRMFTM